MLLSIKICIKYFILVLKNVNLHIKNLKKYLDVVEYIIILFFSLTQPVSPQTTPSETAC